MCVPAGDKEDVAIRSDLVCESFMKWPWYSSYILSKEVDILTIGGTNGRLFLDGMFIGGAIGAGDAASWSNREAESFTTSSSSMALTRH